MRWRARCVDRCESCVFHNGVGYTYLSKYLICVCMELRSTVFEGQRRHWIPILHLHLRDA